jgi:hypothetical protein
MNMLLYLAIAMIPTALAGAVLAVPRLVRWVRRRRATRLPAGPPIEQLAADLRRVHRVLDHYGPGTPMVRRAGTLQAYDELLAQACTAMDIEHELNKLPLGVTLELERLRVEESLRTAGLVIR